MMKLYRDGVSRVVNNYLREWEETHGSLPIDETIEFQVGSCPLWGNYYGYVLISTGTPWHTDKSEGMSLLWMVSNPGYVLETSFEVCDEQEEYILFDQGQEHSLNNNNVVAVEPLFALCVEGRRPYLHHMRLLAERLLAFDNLGAKPKGSKWNKTICL